MNTEKILAHAEVAAVFLRALLDKGIPLQAATSLTSSYLLGHAMREDPPKEPWEDPDA